jgi:hypothetical protein
MPRHLKKRSESKCIYFFKKHYNEYILVQDEEEKNFFRVTLSNCRKILKSFDYQVWYIKYFQNGLRVMTRGMVKTSKLY